MVVIQDLFHCRMRCIGLRQVLTLSSLAVFVADLQLASSSRKFPNNTIIIIIVNVDV